MKNHVLNQPVTQTSITKPALATENDKVNNRLASSINTESNIKGHERVDNKKLNERPTRLESENEPVKDDNLRNKIVRSDKVLNANPVEDDGKTPECEQVAGIFTPVRDVTDARITGLKRKEMDAISVNSSDMVRKVNNEANDVNVGEERGDDEAPQRASDVTYNVTAGLMDDGSHLVNQPTEDATSANAMRAAPFTIISQFVSLAMSEDDHTETEDDMSAASKRRLAKERKSSDRGNAGLLRAESVEFAGEGSLPRPLSLNSLLINSVSDKRQSVHMLRQIHDNEKLLGRINARDFGGRRRDMLHDLFSKDTISDIASSHSAKSDQTGVHQSAPNATEYKPVMSILDEIPKFKCSRLPKSLGMNNIFQKTMGHAPPDGKSLQETIQKPSDHLTAGSSSATQDDNLCHDPAPKTTTKPCVSTSNHTIPNNFSSNEDFKSQPGCESPEINILRNVDRNCDEAVSSKQPEPENLDSRSNAAGSRQEVYLFQVSVEQPFRESMLSNDKVISGESLMNSKQPESFGNKSGLAVDDRSCADGESSHVTAEEILGANQESHRNLLLHNSTRNTENGELPNLRNCIDVSKFLEGNRTDPDVFNSGGDAARIDKNEEKPSVSAESCRTSAMPIVNDVSLPSERPSDQRTSETLAIQVDGSLKMKNPTDDLLADISRTRNESRLENKVSQDESAVKTNATACVAVEKSENPNRIRSERNEKISIARRIETNGTRADTSDSSLVINSDSVNNDPRYTSALGEGSVDKLSKTSVLPASPDVSVSPLSSSIVPAKVHRKLPRPPLGPATNMSLASAMAR